MRQSPRAHIWKLKVLKPECVIREWDETKPWLLHIPCMWVVWVCLSSTDYWRMAIVFCFVCLLKLEGEKKKNWSFSALVTVFSQWFQLKHPWVSFWLSLELSLNQDDATTVEQPEVILLTDDQEEKEGEKGRTALKLTHQE